MKRINRSMSTLLALSMLVPTWTACSGNKETLTDTEAIEDVTTAEETTTVETEAYFSNALQTTDYDGATFRIGTGNAIGGWAPKILTCIATELTGEVVNDALYTRDLWMEKAYNIDVSYENTDTWGGDTYQNGIAAGDLGLELILEETASNCTYLAQRGSLYPMNMVDGIDLEAVYWFPALNESLLMGEDLYYGITAITPRLYVAAGIFMLNRDLLKDLNGLPDLYDSVKNGTWTMEQMLVCGQAALSDLDGNGTYDDKDRYGLLAETMTAETLVMGAGQYYMKNEGGELHITIGDENMYDLLKEVENLMIDPSTLFNDDSRMDFNHIISSGNYLFRQATTSVLEEYRDFGYDYGVLPVPKYTESQAEYYSYANPWVTDSPMIPVSVSPSALTFVGDITNAYAAYGYDHIRPAIFESVLKHRDARDEATAEIIDLVYENVTFSLCAIFWTKTYQEMTAHFSYGVIGSQDITSRYAGFREAAENEKETIMENFREIHNKLAETLTAGN